MTPRPLRFIAMLSTAVLLAACGKDDEVAGPREPDEVDAGGLPPSIYKARAGESWMVPRFSPDGSRIAFIVRRAEGDIFIYRAAVMNADGTDLQDLPSGNAFSLDWSADGTRIFHTAGFGKLYSIPATGGTPVLEYDEYRAEAVDVSPDGRSMVYNVESGELRRLDLTTKEVEVLVGDGYNRKAVFSPEGERVVYLHHTGSGDYETRILTLATKQGTLVTTDVNAWSLADWLPDGRLAAVTRSGISLFDLSGAEPQGRVVLDEPTVRSLDVSPDGKRLLYTSDRAPRDIHVLTGF